MLAWQHPSTPISWLPPGERQRRRFSGVNGESEQIEWGLHYDPPSAQLSLHPSIISLVYGVQLGQHHVQPLRRSSVSKLADGQNCSRIFSSTSRCFPTWSSLAIQSGVCSLRSSSELESIFLLAFRIVHIFEKKKQYVITSTTYIESHRATDRRGRDQPIRGTTLPTTTIQLNSTTNIQENQTTKDKHHSHRHACTHHFSSALRTIWSGIGLGHRTFGTLYMVMVHRTSIYIYLGLFLTRWRWGQLQPPLLQGLVLRIAIAVGVPATALDRISHISVYLLLLLLLLLLHGRLLMWGRF